MGEVCTSDLGKTLNQAKDTGELMPYLCSINVQWDRIDLSTVKQARFELADYERFSVRQGDLLICEGGDIGRAAIWESETPMLYQNALHRVRFRESILPRYCLRYLQHLKLTGVLDQTYGKGVTIKHLVKSSLFSIPIPVPPITEQEKIVAELDCLTGIIEKKKQQLEELDKLAQSIFYDMFGDPITNEKGWDISCFGKIIRTAKVERCGEREGLPVLSITMRNGIVRQSERFKKVIASKDVSAYKVVPRGSLVIAFPIDEGLIYIQDVDKEGIMSPAYNIYDVDYAVVQKEYLVSYFHSAYAMKYYKDKLRGTTQRRRMLAKEDLLAMPIPAPPLTEQQLFAQKMEAIMKQKEMVKRSIVETEALFNSRMDFWFN